MVRNVHVRELAVPAADAGPLLDTLGGPADALWPSPWWPAMKLDQPLRPGSAGGHGATRYRVSRHEPGRLLELTFDPRTGLRGTHTFSVEPDGPGRCRIRHEIDARTAGPAFLAWPIMIRWMHDAVIEDLFDRAERTFGSGPARPARWSRWVRVLRWVDERSRVEPVPVPVDGLLDADGVDSADAFAVPRPRWTSGDPQWWADALFRGGPPAVVVLRVLRDALAGAARAGADRSATRARTDDEVLLVERTDHLEVRSVVRVEPRRVVLATAVDVHDARGRLHRAVVGRVRPRVVGAVLSRAARRARDGAVPPVTSRTEPPAG